MRIEQKIEFLSREIRAKYFQSLASSPERKFQVPKTKILNPKTKI